MKLFKEIKHILGLDHEGKAAWINPEETGRTLSLEDKHADDINAQFVNTGVKLEEVKAEEVERGDGQQTVEGNNIESIQEGTTNEIASEVKPVETQLNEGGTINLGSVSNITEVTETPEQPSEEPKTESK